MYIYINIESFSKRTYRYNAEVQICYLCIALTTTPCIGDDMIPRFICGRNLIMTITFCTL